MPALAFYIPATIAVVAVIFMIIQKNPLSSALFLVLSFLGLTALYASLSAHFVAVLQILIYTGAILVLFIFVIMLLNLKDEELTSDRISWQQLFVLLVGLTVFALFAVSFKNIPPVDFPAVASDFGTVERVAEGLFSGYAFAFELVGLLLLVGIIGAVMLGKRELK